MSLFNDELFDAFESATTAEKSGENSQVVKSSVEKIDGVNDNSVNSVNTNSNTNNTLLSKRIHDTDASDEFNKKNKMVWSDASIGKSLSSSLYPDTMKEEDKIKSTSREEVDNNSTKQDKIDNFDIYQDQAIEIIESKVVTHEVCFPPDYDIENEKVEREKYKNIQMKPAKKYPFTLDPFQQRSIDCLERQQSVLVAAHTSAGKTVVAEYAIAMALRDNQRVIYTSPIKALSNQKYRELYEEFQDVGLMTGDVTINPSASCLVMTTEILRNMLYRGAEIMREVGWLIFDEVHYLRDKERGVVWEETIILLPDKVHFVFLSATIPNASEFALWIAKLHKQPCNVVYTEYRPTPLQHYVFPAGGDGIFLVVDEKGNFREDNFQKALTVLNSDGADVELDKKKKKAQKGPPDIYKVLRMVMEKNYNPVICFSFSKRECETHALNMAKLDLSSDDEKKLIGQIFTNAIDSLSDDDKKLPQVEKILPLLKRGIGIHHSGLLPILKEVVEILFQEGLLKALFSTETFSMGLNMPAKTVIFTSIRKFDGEDFRVVSSGEYIQMSGRAGRRGLDDRGIVILMLDEKLEPNVCKNTLKGAADCLNSSFHLGYNMLLNLLRVEEADPNYMISRSFHQFQAQRAAPQMAEQLTIWEKERDVIKIDDEKGISEYFKIKSEISLLEEKLRTFINNPLNILPFLNPGRLIRVVDGSTDWGWGIVVCFQKLKSDDSLEILGSKASSNYIVDVLLRCSDEDETSSKKKVKPGDGEMQVVPIVLQCIHKLSSIRVNIAKDLKSKENRKTANKTLKEVLKRFHSDLPLLDPVDDMKIEDADFLAVVKEMDRYEERLSKHKLHETVTLNDQYSMYEKKARLESQIKTLKTQISDISQSVVHRSSLRSMKRILKKLGFVNHDSVVTLKGRVACEISTVDELLATEMIYGGIFNNLKTEQIVSLVSCLVYTEKSDEAVKIKDELMAPLRQLQECARKIAKVSNDCGITLDENDYITSFKPHLMEITSAWCRGAKFIDVIKQTNIFEGSIIRAFRRLEEVLRQFASASRVIGNEELEAKFEDGISKIKRDVVFSSSLFL